MINRLRYFFELILLLPFFPFLYFKGKKLRETIIKLKPQSEFLASDGIHPSDKGYELMAKETIKSIQKKVIPTESSERLKD